MKSHAPVALLALTAATTVAAAPTAPATSAKAIEQHHGAAPSNTADHHPAKQNAEVDWVEFHAELAAEREAQKQKRDVEPTYAKEGVVKDGEGEKGVMKRSAEPASCAGSCPGYCVIL